LSTKSHVLDERYERYVRNHALARESAVHARLREATAALPEHRMQISVEQGRLMSLLTGLAGARRAIEVGVFTGYSALCVAERLPPDGVLVACDVSQEWTGIGRRHWEEAGVADRIDLRIGPAAETLSAMIAAGESGTYDLAFIDADKEPYDVYYERCLELLRPGGLVLIDNVFMHGRAVEPEADDAAGKAVKALTAKIAEDDRVEPALVPIGDGLMLARKRGRN